jgi:hypothetical protein
MIRQHRHHRDGLAEALRRVGGLMDFQRKYGTAALHQQRARRHWLREAEKHYTGLTQQHSTDAARWMARELAPRAEVADVFEGFLAKGTDY